MDKSIYAAVALAIMLLDGALVGLCLTEQGDAKNVQDAQAAQVVVQDSAQVAIDDDESGRGFRFYACVPLCAEEQGSLQAACDRFNVDFALMLGLIQRETDFRNIHGDGGDSIGYCQVQPRWWRGLMDEIGAKDLNKPADNFMTAAAILRSHCDNYGSWESALTAYNTGSAGSSEYADCVVGYWQQWTEKLESEV